MPNRGAGKFLGRVYEKITKREHIWIDADGNQVPPPKPKNYRGMVRDDGSRKGEERKQIKNEV